MKSNDKQGRFAIPVSEMSREERAAHISDNELIRAHIVQRIERILVELSNETGNKRYRKRGRRIGKKS